MNTQAVKALINTPESVKSVVIKEDPWSDFNRQLLWPRNQKGRDSKVLVECVDNIEELLPSAKNQLKELKKKDTERFASTILDWIKECNAFPSYFRSKKRFVFPKSMKPKTKLRIMAKMKSLGFRVAFEENDQEWKYCNHYTKKNVKCAIILILTIKK